MKDKVSALLVEMIDVAWKCIQNEKNGYYNMDILGKIGIAVIECKTSMKLNPVNASEIDFIINKIEDRLCSGENLFYYTSFYKVPQVVYRNDPEEFGLLVKKLNIDITSFRIRVAASNIFNFALNASEDDYFFARGHEIIRGFTNAITNDKDELFVPLLYVMLNYFQAVKEYTMCEDNSQQEYALKMGEKCVGFFKYIFDISKYVNMISSNIQLSFFWTALTHEFGLSCISTKEEDFDSRIGDKERWALLSLSKLDNKLFLEIFGTRHSDILNTTYENTSKSILMFRLITTYLFLTNDNDFSNNVINTPMLRFEGTCPYGPEYFLMNYSGIKNQEISAEEMELLNSYDDSQLRQKICSLIVNVDGNELKRQVSKLRIPEHPDGDSGNIRTRNRRYPDTLPANLIVK